MPKSWPPPPPPARSLLDYHRLLSPTAAVKVSPLCLGAMNFGTAWQDFMGPCDKPTTFAMLDYFFSQGGNFIDTASNYQDEESERWIGEWMAARGNRDQMVVATKYTTNWTTHEGHEGKISANFGGNNKKSLRLSVDASLKKLQTDYIDVLYVHWWDYTTSIEELMHSLNDLVVAGKVLYLGISDTPAWIVSKANQFARSNSLRPFAVYQGHWSCALRDFEREIIPMCRAEGMGIAPWGALGRGHFKDPTDTDKGRNMGPQSSASIAVSEVLSRIAKEKSYPITSVALAYVMHKTPYVFPIVGGRKIEHLKGNIEALGLELTVKEIEEIEGASPFDLGFPYNFLTKKTEGAGIGPADVFLAHGFVNADYVEAPKAIEAGRHRQ